MEKRLTDRDRQTDRAGDRDRERERERERERKRERERERVRERIHHYTVYIFRTVTRQPSPPWLCSRFSCVSP